MSELASGFVDPTIPGLSGRDLVRRAGDAIVTLMGKPSCLHGELLVRRDLADLDSNLLRDLGLDRNAS